MLLFSFRVIAQMVNPYWSAPKTNVFIASQAGGATNHVRGEMTIQWPKDNPSFAVVTVDVVQEEFSLPGTNYMYQTDGVDEFGRKVPRFGYQYYFPTNEFCGPMQLQNVRGQQMLSLQTKVSSLSGYPDFFNFNKAEEDYFSKFMSYSGPPFPIPADRFRNSMQFTLTNLFVITNAGEYRLTVWPKLYTRDQTNRDLCVRVDLPPVSINFNWPGGAPAARP